ncbi:hypothetical protein BGZ54_010290 [Gamsiella multidivaricata]|nr:hypothetical protein BGZ54_010290 [Gamsiella multidivaricata]
MGLSMKSQYFPDDSMLDEDVNLSYDFDDSMHSSESTPQAVPTFPNSGVGSGCDSSLPYRHHHKNGGMFEVFHDDKNRVTVPEGTFVLVYDNHSHELIQYLRCSVTRVYIFDGITPIHRIAKGQSRARWKRKFIEILKNKG